MGSNPAIDEVTVVLMVLYCLALALPFSFPDADRKLGTITTAELVFVFAGLTVLALIILFKLNY